MNAVLSSKQQDVLDSLAVFGGRSRAWARPMDIGARDGSHHTGTLRALIKKGFVERELRWGLLNSIRGQETYDAWAKVKRGRSAPRGSYKYRLTPRGWKAVRP
jgi:hypothetical protein